MYILFSFRNSLISHSNSGNQSEFVPWSVEKHLNLKGKLNILLYTFRHAYISFKFSFHCRLSALFLDNFIAREEDQQFFLDKFFRDKVTLTISLFGVKTIVIFSLTSFLGNFIAREGSQQFFSWQVFLENFIARQDDRLFSLTSLPWKFHCSFFFWQVFIDNFIAS